MYISMNVPNFIFRTNQNPNTTNLLKLIAILSVFCFSKPTPNFNYDNPPFSLNDISFQ